MWVGMAMGMLHGIFGTHMTPSLEGLDIVFQSFTSYTDSTHQGSESTENIDLQLYLS